ncbi:beta-ketoacyl-[acyl-carrier-protein] synthase family protein [Candidatus Omnitrophota bacterium]
MNKRVVVTGLGIISSIGIGKDVFWNSLMNGRSGISEISLFDTSRFNRRYAGEIKDFLPEIFIPHKFITFLGRASQFTIASVKLALEDAFLSLREIKEKKVAVVIGVTIPEGDSIDFSSEMILKGQFEEIESKILLNIFAPAVARNVGNFFKIKDTNLLIPCACAAGNYAIGHAFDLIKKSEVDLAIAGGSEALSRIAFQGFQRLNAMSIDKCSPFDRDRKGMILGEGCGILIIESLERALERNAPIYAEVLGYGLSCDAHHITIPEKRGVIKAMRKALDSSGVIAEDIDYISAHGTGTPANDKTEAAAIKELFSSRCKKIPVSSIKSMLGHCMGAATAIEAITCCLALKEQKIPPTINFCNPDPECDIDCVPNKARNAELNVVLNNGFAFGGNNCCVVFSCMNKA